MIILEKILKTKSDQNTHQNAPNCTILKIFLGEHAPKPPSKKSEKSEKKSCPPPHPKSWLRPCHIIIIE